jgi:hypothetical protein
MNSNSTSLDSCNYDNLTSVLQIFCVVPEYINLFFLSCGIYGMYRGIEIAHPLYAVLFLNLIVPLVSTTLNIAAFFFISTVRYIVFSNIINALSLFFHCTSWLVTSGLRFVYIIYGDWFNNWIPSQKLQSISAVIVTCVLTVILSLPTFSILIFYGKLSFILFMDVLTVSNSYSVNYSI